MIKRKKKKGFTLIELVIVLAVLAIIALIAIPNFTRVRNNALKQADDTSSEQITNIIQTAIAEGVLEPVVTTAYTATITVNGPATRTAVEEETPRIEIGDGLPYNLTFGGGTDGTNAKAALQDHLRDIEAPQEAGKTHYSVNIAEGGRVSTVTEPIQE